MKTTPSLFKKILLINPFGIGDVLFTTPMISSIKAAHPQTFIGFVANARTAPLLSLNSKIDKVFVYERDEFNALYKKSKIEFFRRAGRLLQDIKREQFDTVMDLSLNGNMSFLSWSAGIPRRIGFNYKNRSPFLTDKIPLSGYEKQHVAEYYLSLLAHLGVPVQFRNLEMTVPEEDHQWAQEIWGSQKFSSARTVVGIIPGGGASWGKDATYKRWPAEKFAKLADKIIENSSAAIILMGDQTERELCFRIAQLMHSPAVSLAGETSITQLAAVCAKCQFVVVNDGGPLHVAVAAGAKTVSIFGPVDEKVYGPFPAQNQTVVTKDIACRPCYRRFRRAQCEHMNCLNTLTVDEVFEKIQTIL